jgi:hypothetical protein
MVTMRELKIGDLFTRKAVAEPKESQVYVRSGYDRTTKTFECYKWDDVNHVTRLRGDIKVHVDFVF